MIIHKKATLDKEGNFIDVYECQVCGLRSTFKEIILGCIRKHIEENHREEAKAGIL